MNKISEQTNYQDEFKRRYTAFEDWAREHFPKMRDMLYLENNYALEPYKKRLEFFRHVRNLLIHYNDVQGFCIDEMVTVNEAFLKGFNSLVDEIAMPAIHHAIPMSSIIYRSIDDCVKSAICDMVRLNITHLPILEGKRVVGLFGENVLFRIMCEGQVMIEDNTTFAEIEAYIHIDQCKLAKAVRKDITIPECFEIFSRAISQWNRLDLLLITKDGTYRSDLLGLITTWDMAGIK